MANIKVIFDFLEKLSQNNTREWFQDNKPEYEAAKNEFETLTSDIINGFGGFDKDIAILRPKDCIFRIYRDVRFSKDKNPYKTHFGSYFVKGGRNSGNAGYYLHLDPADSFIGGGIHMPPAPTLKAIRTEIYNYTPEFKKIIEHKDFTKEFGQIDGEKLKKAPKGFPADYEDIELLKFKSYTFGKKIPQNVLFGKGLLEEINKSFKTMIPLISFINTGIQENPV